MKKSIVILTLCIVAHLAQAQVMTIKNGATVYVNRNGSTMTTPILNIKNGAMSNAGTLVDAGSVVINGAYSESGIVEVKIGGATLGTTYDQVSTTGAITLGTSTLNVSFSNSYTPSGGESFTIIDGASISGTFTNVNLPALSAGLTWTTSYNFVAGTLILSINSVILPVELLDFTAKATPDNNSLVQWQTALEENVAHFEVERSRNGQDFESIGKEKPKGSNSKYNFLDASPNKGINYYRLKINDLDGAISYSKIEAVKIGDKTFKINAYPTIVTDVLNVKTDGGEINEVIIVNVAGQIVYQKAAESLSSQGFMQLDLSDLPSATYFVKVKNSEENINIVKFIKN